MRCPHIHRLPFASRRRGVGEAAECQAKSARYRAGVADIAETNKGRAQNFATCGPAFADEASCRMFLCGRCRAQVLICRRCDRGQIYCVGTCAQLARRDRQREARRRYQATPRGRAMHADRSRRYRARQHSVTDHSSSEKYKPGLLPGVDAHAAFNEPSHGRSLLQFWLCQHCGQSASPFVRLSALRPAHYRRNAGRSDRFGRPP